MGALAARSAEPEREFAFGLCLQLFGPWLKRAGARERARALSGSAGLAAPLLLERGFEPDRRGMSDDRLELGAKRSSERARRQASDSRFPLFHGLQWLAANIAERTPLLISIDDAHWADVPSLEFVHYLAQRVEELAIVLLLSSRPTGRAEGERPLSELAAHPLARRLTLEPLSARAVSELARALLPGEPAEPFCRALWELTAGNPLFVGELCRAARDHDLEPSAAGVAAITELGPRSVSLHVLTRLVRLGDDARALAEALALLGDGTTLRHASTIAGLHPAAAGVAADALLAAEILSVTEVDGWSFAHPLVRDAIYGELPPARRGRWHLQAARLLNAEAAAPEVICTHLLAAPDSGEPWALQVLRHSAKRALAHGAPEFAVRYLERAAREPLRAGQRIDLLVRLAQAEATTDVASALGHIDQALELVEERPARAGVLVVRGRVLALGGQHAAAFSAFRQAAGELGEPDRELQIRMAAAAVQAGIVTDETKRLVDSLRHRPGAAELPEERRLMAGIAARSAIRGEPAQRFASLALGSIEEDTLLEDLAVDGGLTISVAAIALLYADELTASLRLLDRALARARQEGSALAGATVSYLRAWPHYFAGPVQEAIADAEQALSARSYGWSMHRGAAAAILAHARIERGDCAGAQAALTDAQGFSSGPAETTLILTAQGRLRALQRDPKGALQDLRDAGHRLDELGVSDRPIAWRPIAALAALGLGDREQAAALAAEERARAEQTGVARTIAMALRAAGLVEGGPAGVELLGQAVSTIERSPARLEHARSLLAYGSALRRGGERVSAREPLRKALDLGHRIGATLIATEAALELKATGARPRRILLTGVQSLTASERRVAGMAAQGMSNREIAQALFVTVYAVEKHLRASFQKLDLHSRTQLAGVLDADGDGA